MSKIEQALIWMLKQIADGKEYPDAHTSAAKGLWPQWCV